ncbi:MAG: TAXI family TRAP transporter solute-binding subunit [Beijerinckiaceae bacterium]
MRQPSLAFLAALLGLIGLSALGYYVATRPTTLRIAVGPVVNENVRTVSAAQLTLQREREPFRLRLVVTDGAQETARALDSGEVDLAIIRPDSIFPRNGATVAIMHRDHAMLVAPGPLGLTKVSDLKGKSVALMRDSPGNLRMLGIIASQAGLAPNDITVTRVPLAGLRTALDEGRIQAILAVGPTSGRLLSDIVTLVTDAGNGKISFLPVPEPSAIEQRNPFLEPGVLVRGLFSGTTPRPEVDTPTLTVAHHLLASKTLPDTTVSDFTRVILTAKSQIAAEAPLAARMEAPDQEKTNPIPIHPGTITYLDGQTSTFLERYGDWFYIGIMGLGLGGSAFAGYLSVNAANTRKKVMDMLVDLQSLVAEIPDAGDGATLTSLSTRAESIFQETIQNAIEDNVDPAAMTAFSMAFSHLRQTISEKRRLLDENIQA